MGEEEKPNWFVSSSPESDQKTCEMFRYLGYHAGPDQTGMRRSGKSIPLTTGTLVHEALAQVVKEKITGPGERTEEILQGLKEGYWDLVKEAGYQGRDQVPENEKARIQEIFDEQTTLLDGLTYGWLQTASKDFYRRFKILAIEQEMPLLVPWKNENANLIRGSKQDLVVEDERGNAGVINWKTTADWKYMQYVPNYPQTMMECVAAEAHLQRPVRWYMIYGLVKGSMTRTKLLSDEGRTYSGPERQDSVLCYPFYMPSIPGVQEEDFQPSYYRVDSKGKKKAVGDRYKKPYAEPLSPLITKHMTTVEWLKRIPQETLNKLFIEAGPYWINPYQVEQYLRGLAGSELRYVEQLRAAREAEEKLGGWKNEKFQAELDGIFGRNYTKCDDMFYRPCPMRDVCRKQGNWKEWQGFQPREPHYDFERESAGG